MIARKASDNLTALYFAAPDACLSADRQQAGITEAISKCINKRIGSTLTSFAFLRARYCHVAVHQAKNNILI